MMRTRIALRGLVTFALGAVFVAASPTTHAGLKPEADGSGIAALALANVGQGACTTNTLGGTHFASSCTGNGGYPEYWCADFAIWAWQSSGVTDVAGLTAAAGSFYVYGQNHGTLSNTPAVGDAVVFNYAGGGVADHVAIVTQVNADGTIESASGDWGGSGSTQAAFASTSSVVLNAPAYPSAVGGTPSAIGMTISGYIAPVGLGFDYGAAFVSQSFPLASTAVTMVAGQTLSAYIELKNTGTKAWGASTHLATSNPRDRASDFADGTWMAANRPAGVSGSVAPGDSYKFTFTLHAPTKPGTYLEYFNVVEEGVAWFSDPGQGGPVDADLEANIVVVAAPEQADAGSAPPDAAPAPSSDGGGSGSVSSDGGAPPVSPGAGGSTGPVRAPTPAPSDDAGASANGASSGGAGTSAGGCAMAPVPGTSENLGWILGAGALVFAARRRSRRAR